MLSLCQGAVLDRPDSSLLLFEECQVEFLIVGVVLWVQAVRQLNRGLPGCLSRLDLVACAPVCRNEFLSPGHVDGYVSRGLVVEKTLLMNWIREYLIQFACEVWILLLPVVVGRPGNANLLASSGDPVALSCQGQDFLLDGFTELRRLRCAHLLQRALLPLTRLGTAVTDTTEINAGCFRLVDSRHVGLLGTGDTFGSRGFLVGHEFSPIVYLRRSASQVSLMCSR